jgi:hypothetical protein
VLWVVVGVLGFGWVVVWVVIPAWIEGQHVLVEHVLKKGQ